MELHLDRSLVEKRLYPAIHILQSGTRREDLLYHPEEWERVQLLQDDERRFRHSRRWSS